MRRIVIALAARRRLWLAAVIAGTGLAAGLIAALSAFPPGTRTTWEVCAPRGAYVLTDRAGDPHSDGQVPESERIIRVGGQELSRFRQLGYVPCGGASH